MGEEQSERLGDPATSEFVGAAPPAEPAPEPERSLRAVKPLGWFLRPLRPLLRSGRRVHELMSEEVATCRPDDDLQAVARTLWERDCGVVPVVDDEGHVLGVVTDRDMCMAAFTKGRRLAELRAGEVMAHEVVTCRPGDDAKDVLHAMQERQVRRLPVVDPGRRLVGIVSLADLARAGLPPGDIARTLAAICRPWPRPAQEGRAAS